MTLKEKELYYSAYKFGRVSKSMWTEKFGEHTKFTFEKWLEQNNLKITEQTKYKISIV